MKKRLFAFVSILLLSSCISYHVPVNTYFPTDYPERTRYSGAVNIGQFKYLPYEQGKVKSNQVQHSSTNVDILFDIGVAEFIAKATTAELGRSGIKLGNAKTTVEGNIKKLGVRYQVHYGPAWYDPIWEYVINYRLLNDKDGLVLLDRDYYANRRFITHTSYDIQNDINKLFYSGYEKFIGDPDVREILLRK